MTRANRHFIPGHIWHITHRCHQKEFLLKFSRDRSRWMEFLFEAKKRFQLSILNFIVTSNHIHLIVSDKHGNHTIPRSMQLIAGRTAQEYNRRKGRRGAFWEDRYHATAIESGEHLWRCMVYIDLNMVRAGVIDHPGEWKWSGYNEIQKPKARYRLVDLDTLRQLLNVETNEELAETHQRWLDSQPRNEKVRQGHFSNSLAVGSKAFVKRVKGELKGRALARRISEVDDSGFQLKETLSEYRSNDVDHSGILKHEAFGSNKISWNQNQFLEMEF